MRRTKKDIQEMTSLCEYWLIYHSNNDPQIAYNEYIKYYLEAGIQLPYYVNGIRDFITVSKKIEAEKEQRQQEQKQEQIKETYKKQREEDHKSIIQKILSLSVDQFINAYRQAKETGTEKHKMALCDMAMLQKSGELKEEFITYDYIDICKKYCLI